VAYAPPRTTLEGELCNGAGRIFAVGVARRCPAIPVGAVDEPLRCLAGKPVTPPVRRSG
jgi:hypothetical protein